MIKLAQKLGLLICSIIFSNISIAATKDLAEIASGVKPQITALSSVMIMLAYVLGIGFSLVGVLQFKAHKDNPQQTPLSKPIVSLILGASLVFLPTVMKSTGKTILGADLDAGDDGAVTNIEQ